MTAVHSHEARRENALSQLARRGGRSGGLSEVLHQQPAAIGSAVDACTWFSRGFI
jgi:hypothetical protein